ncbi:NupC/NupG family nucleoside CNT transporter [Peredibacter starrii]|uniref:Nucleoside transporter C-terminal domain-containing protein n=1 Tax=Peredibacter starrii TaxID=28202 RepID=A0AAX4HMD7_9BACT|nr:nucleoside transporter C-terminal domain-containing protein [Peredibacter starrii]WPU64438.1 nucleoside transporter C-terminal domain-containing protein [Peredibacter starrii]
MNLESLLRGILGICVLIGILYLFSSKKKEIPWKLVGLGLLLQIIFALSITHIPFVASIFERISSVFVVVLSFTKQGSTFVFGNLMDVKSIGFIFAFQVLPTIIFFSALTSLLFYLGILQRVVFGLSWLLGRFLKISGAENLSATANIFLGQTEAPLLIKPYLDKMTRSEILCVMVGGMGSTAGGVLAAYVGFLGGDDPVQQLYFAKHLLAASVMSAPAAIIVSKILLPQTENVDTSLNLANEKVGSSMLESVALGTEDGLKLALNVAAMLIVFIAMIAMVNFILNDLFGYYTGLNTVIQNFTGGQYSGVTLQFILGYLCSPLVWLMGVPHIDMVSIGQLLGEKTILNEFVAYTTLAKMKEISVLQSPKSLLMATYLLSGFANFSSIGIQLGGIGGLAPSKRGMLAELGLKALLGGTFASLLSATIIGMLN